MFVVEDEIIPKFSFFEMQSKFVYDKLMEFDHSVFMQSVLVLDS